VTTLVLKPSLLGGFLPTLALAQHARKLGLQCVVSSAFESPLGITQLSYLAAVVDSLNSSPGEKGATIKIAKGASEKVHHGLGTGVWWDDLEEQPIPVRHNVDYIRDHFMQRFTLEELRAVTSPEFPAVLDLKLALPCTNISSSNSSSDLEVVRKVVEVETDAGKYSFNLLETHLPASSSSTATSTTATATTIVFLHGFLGQPEEWLPFMKVFSTIPSATTAATGEAEPYRCLALSLPGHGSTVSPKTSTSSQDLDAYSLESTATAIEMALEKLGVADCVVVGYSLGARLALLLSTRRGQNNKNSNHNHNNGTSNSNLNISKVISISGLPGIPENDLQEREQRAKIDSERAETLRNDGLESFMASWYASPMWDTLTKHNKEVFIRTVLNRKRGFERVDLSSLSLTLEKMSPGRAPDVRSDLYCLSTQGKLPKMLLIAGIEDAKFVGIAEDLVQNFKNENGQSPIQRSVEAVVVQNCGHTVHVEQPVVLLQLLFDFITSTE
jgi:isochorismate synthase/2-succinyl-5-enolpyruvyl-6-hydroxy-3-cyclohexene-1-carboxylate synthase/2-succinyl-6-hydroxy-2,4-cyclohexadiene-1-carboxylate synthase/O-succinylbenzoate synthase